MATIANAKVDSKYHMDGEKPMEQSASTRASVMYPAINPYDSGMLNVGDGHAIYWEVCGNPKGKPVVFLHGGPGGGCSPEHRRLFNPEKYRIVLFDQRGCGRSTPHASLEANTTWHLVDDMERIRSHLHIHQWQLFGGSWGSTLALAYAQSFPERVTELVLRGIFLLRQAELHWYYQEGASWMCPDRWEGFLAPIPVRERGDLIAAYRRLLTGDDEVKKLGAARAWSSWEASTVTMVPNPSLIAEFKDPQHALAFARIENHYFVHKGFMEEGQLLANIDRMKNIPGVIVQGLYDLVTPPKSAWDLHAVWHNSTLHLVPVAGHAYNEPGILQRLIAATDAYADV
jgi:proline iminopeptidase